MIKNDFLSADDFLYIKEKIFEFVGIHLTEKKLDLVRARLQSSIRKSEIKSLADLKNQIEQGNPQVIQLFINNKQKRFL